MRRSQSKTSPARLGGGLSAAFYKGAILSDGGDRIAAADEAQLAQNKAVAEQRSVFVDRQQPHVRAVLQGLPNPVDLAYALEDGCRTQADAEEWVRKNYGPSAVERYN
jgi:hypothetical protein